VGVLSFGGSKLLTSGRGGALLTRDDSVRQRARVLFHRGNHVCPMSEIQAAVLIPQLGKLDTRNAHRAENVRRLTESSKAVPGLRLFVNRAVDSQPVYYKLGMQFDAARFGLSRELFLGAIRAEGVAMDEGFNALHVGRSPRRQRRLPDLTEAERAHASAVVLHHPVLLAAASDIEEIALAVRRVYANAGLLLQAAVQPPESD
jgi:dTDP-4-amino-4,6-dideoxygalactose transaminase